jgi:predicted LPLAT superfamily acyltransferase/3-hydroxymyristoyl/3-hydroxydecanoyl-(acyl carrier protein) dehydratase
VGATTTTFTIDPRHPALAGHFPGSPILPGVVLLDETVRMLEQTNGGAAQRWTVGAAKFLKPVQPGETLTLECEPRPNGSIRFTVSSAGRAVASGVLRPSRATPAAGTGTAAEPLASDAHWAGARERGSATLFRWMMFLSLTLGRPTARVLLCGIAGYFFLFAPRARRCARQYLRRALGRRPTAADVFSQVFAFAVTILDRLYLARERYELFDITVEDEPLLRSIVTRGAGAFLLGAHLGSFEIMSAIGRRQPGLRVAMAMYEDTATKLRAFSAANPASAPEIIPLGHLDAMLRIHDCLEAGSFVGMLADRTIGEAPAQRVSFLGRPALFPSGPMRAAAALKRQVFFMAGLYRGANRYHVVFRQLADFSATVPRGEREARVQEAIRRYAAVLEECCRSDPYNWFNFYDFWHEAEVDAHEAVG